MDHNDTLFNILQPDDLTTVHPNAGRWYKMVSSHGTSLLNSIWGTFMVLFCYLYLSKTLEKYLKYFLKNIFRKI